MKTITLGKSSLPSSRLAYGCWRIAETEDAGRTTGRAAILAAIEAGYTLFDHADIYGKSRAEAAFGAVLRETPALRQQMLIATKCGIRFAGEPTPDAPFRYDFSAEHIIRACEGSLRRLAVETIDLYQLHRPDWLMDPHEVVAAFEQLRRQGKVREFGVSNFQPSQVALLQKACPFPLVVNQVEVSLAHLDCFQDGTLDQCQAEQITPLAWSPLAGGKLAEGARRLLPWQENYRVDAIVTELDAQAQSFGVARGTLALAWLLKHPAGIVPIVGSTQPEKIRAATQADQLHLSREQWYRLLEAARGERLP
ncbi:MAG: aldo/keto reductase [Verrucomicrobia bacterium]|nr:MAG: aldo/keto reductase [Verrucomicrobiota bacterium]